MYKYSPLVLLIGLVFLFQNCSEVKFKPLKKENAKQESVSNDAQFFSSQLVDKTAYVGENVEFVASALVSNDSQVQYKWSKSNNVMTESQILQILNVQMEDQGEYALQISVDGVVQDLQVVGLTVLACAANSQTSCSVSNGSGVKTCAADGSGYGSCQATSCNSGYHVEGGVCKQSILPFKSVISLGDRSSSFGCAGSGWRNVKVRASGTSLTISASQMRADYRWKSASYSANAYSGIRYAYRRDHTQLKIDSNGDLVGRCKNYTGWSKLLSNPLCSGIGQFSKQGCVSN